MSANILSISYDPSIAVTRNAVLECAGYSVSQAHDLSQAVRWLTTRHFDLVIVGHTVPQADRRALLAQIRVGKGTRRPDAPVLSLYANEHTMAEGADAAVHVLEGPDQWLETVKSLVCRSKLEIAG